MKNEYRTLIEEFTKIRKALGEEEKVKTPLIYPLESNAQRIKELLDNSKIIDEEFLNWKYWKLQNLKNLIADMPGELYHDYDKGNQRYRGKWVSQKRKIEGVISCFKSEFKTHMGD